MGSVNGALSIRLIDSIISYRWKSKRNGNWDRKEWVDRNGAGRTLCPLRFCVPHLGLLAQKQRRLIGQKLLTHTHPSPPPYLVTDVIITEVFSEISFEFNSERK